MGAYFFLFLIHVFFSIFIYVFMFFFSFIDFFLIRSIYNYANYMRRTLDGVHCAGWFPNLTRAYDNNGRCPRQKLVFGILQLILTARENNSLLTARERLLWYLLDKK